MFSRALLTLNLKVDYHLSFQILKQKILFFRRKRLEKRDAQRLVLARKCLLPGGHQSYAVLEMREALSRSAKHIYVIVI